MFGRLAWLVRPWRRARQVVLGHKPSRAVLACHQLSTLPRASGADRGVGEGDGGEAIPSWLHTEIRGYRYLALRLPQVRRRVPVAAWRWLVDKRLARRGEGLGSTCTRTRDRSIRSRSRARRCLVLVSLQSSRVSISIAWRYRPSTSSSYPLRASSFKLKTRREDFSRPRPGSIVVCGDYGADDLQGVGAIVRSIHLPARPTIFSRRDDLGAQAVGAELTTRTSRAGACRGRECSSA